MNWESLDHVSSFEKVFDQHGQANQCFAVFKHSTRCGISRMALSSFENNYESKDQNVTYYLLDLLSYRDVSNAIAQELNIQHQSPQVVVLKDEKVIHTESHHGIDVKKIQQLIN